MIGIADLADRRHAALVHQPHFAAGQTKLGVDAFFRQKLRRDARRARKLAASPGSSSTLWISVPTGMSRMGSALPDADFGVLAAGDLVAHRRPSGATM